MDIDDLTRRLVVLTNETSCQQAPCHVSIIFESIGFTSSRSMCNPLKDEPEGWIAMEEILWIIRIIQTWNVCEVLRHFVTTTSVVSTPNLTHVPHSKAR